MPYIPLTSFTPVVLSKNNKILIIVNLVFNSFFLRTTRSATLLPLVTRKLDSRRTQNSFHKFNKRYLSCFFKIYQMRWHIRVKEKLRFIIIYNKMAKAYLKCQHFQKVGDVSKACRQWNVTCILWPATAYMELREAQKENTSVRGITRNEVKTVWQVYSISSPSTLKCKLIICYTQINLTFKTTLT